MVIKRQQQQVCRMRMIINPNESEKFQIFHFKSDNMSAFITAIYIGKPDCSSGAIGSYEMGHEHKFILSENEMSSYGCDNVLT